ncbi:50S ribosomal protein L11 methyltransferase [Hyphobacterium sp. CCMP332]|nr:50S ribosomal protein L11 methyltransferase [Hyphobacterium sp. CCMP332]
MPEFYSLRIKSDNPLPEYLSILLDNYGFEGIIEHSDNEIEAFIRSEHFKKDIISDFLKEFTNDEGIQVNISKVEEKNWNETWESSFEAIEIDNKLRIRAPFHPTSDKFDIEIIIEPKMSFGTGHHATTYQMAQLMLQKHIEDQYVLDAGCGTGLLSILAEKLGAKKVSGFDVEEWAFNNSLENLKLNNCTKTNVFKGDAQKLPYDQKDYDLILANITKNILKEDIPVYLNCLRPGGTLMISGFFEEDIPEMQYFSKNLGLEVIKTKTKNNWAALELHKIR